MDSIYKAALLDHYKHPRNKHLSTFEAHFCVARGRNPRCGDDIEVGIVIDSHAASDKSQAIVSKIGFRGRGCSVCLASASMMTECVSGVSTQHALALAESVGDWMLSDRKDEVPILTQLQPLAAIKHHPARKKCAMLAWNALVEAINAASKGQV